MEVHKGSTCVDVMKRSIEHFNAELKQKGWQLRIKEDVGLYSMRMAKKKNGFPSFN